MSSNWSDEALTTNIICDISSDFWKQFSYDADVPRNELLVLIYVKVARSLCDRWFVQGHWENVF